ncbi:permease [Thalassobacillus sp. CUG 92003]|uniref:permease n=1 Tax=Thalassobacillus sp. CUG 92003 TaxID=2736641 RepID=UPI0015E76AE9|nr:permease [Thalassobacillus sp. CUG 92003]
MLIDTLISFGKIAAELTLLFVVVSFVISWIQGYIPYEKIERILTGRNKLIGALAAVLFAFITPFCSCSTIPIVVNMLQKHLNFGIVMIFLFASPLLDPTILTVMGVILGWKVTMIYTVVTALFAIVIGFTLEAFGMEKLVKNVVMSGYEHQSDTPSLKKAWHETMVLMKTVFPYLILGALIGAVIHGLIPTELVGSLLGHEKWWLVPIAAIVGIPLYIRLSSMVPISHVLISKGVALGPIMAMMISSAGASLPEVVLLKSIFKTELVVIFVASVITMSTVSGFVFYLV